MTLEWLNWCWNDRDGNPSIPASFRVGWPRNDFFVIPGSVLSFRDENQWAGMMGWCRNDVNESGMSPFHSHAIIPMPSHHSGVIPPFKKFKTRGSDASELAFSKSQSTQPPLQRGLGGLTSRLEWQEWFFDDWMIQEWWNDAWMSLGWDSDWKLEVSPPNPLCRGGWVDWLHA